ncbi:hypothetical protein CBS101457_003542 [Exobasidium rhododendri]|nr:hypothetical protein CBS101457_003542 [Exobasidium rhododendri]
MVYVKKWPQFQSQCLDLYQKSPNKTRYLIKATPSQLWLVLKVTDDETCLKYKTRSAIILNRFEAFTRDVTASMAGLPLPSIASATIPTATKDVEMKDDVKAAAAAGGNNNQSASAGPGANTGGGGGKKKKKKGGKK